MCGMIYSTSIVLTITLFILLFMKRMFLYSITDTLMYIFHECHLKKHVPEEQNICDTVKPKTLAIGNFDEFGESE